MMDNGQMAQWVARAEHMERMESQKRHDAFLRDIQSDDFVGQNARKAGSKPVQTAGLVSFIKQQLGLFNARLEPKRELDLDCTEAGYEKNCV